ncbi:MAG: FtsX-like permease family protein [Thermoplasmata archaeon]|nr:MAG: FtsX-like permease family protein [Thermoplasmata archaeon]
MNHGWILFGIFFFIIFILIITAYIYRPTFVNIAFRNIINRPKSAALAISGLFIGSTIISGSLILGDSMEYMVKEITLENLGELDITVTSYSYFDYSLYDTLAADTQLGNITDKISPVITLYGSIQNEAKGSVIPKIRIVGYDENAFVFGDFKTKSTTQNSVSKVILNDIAGTALKSNVGDLLKLQIATPEYSIDTIYKHEFGENKTIELELFLTEIVYREGFAQLQNSARTSIIETIYLPLENLQEILGVEGKINTILVSNKGDAENGIDYDDAVTSRLEELLDEYAGMEELGIELLNVKRHDYIRYSSENIFFSAQHENFMDGIDTIEGISGFSPTLTYFANFLESESGETTWYPTVTGLDTDIDSNFEMFKDHITGEWIAGDIADDEIIINNLTADELGVQPGDSISINYMVLDRLYNPQNISVSFKVKYIVDMEGKATDRWLMPDFPGIDADVDAEPSDWDPLFYINQTRVLSLKYGFEHNYWIKYRGAPKAFITLNRAQELWKNDFGDLTGYKIYYDSSMDTDDFIDDLKTQLEEKLDSEIQHGDAGFTINRVKSDGFKSADALSIFPQMFLAFGSIIIIAGFIFVINIMVTIVYNRRRELGILRALGFRIRAISAILSLEGLLYALIASILGTFLGLGVAYGLAQGLNGIWSNIVENLQVPFHFTIESLFFAFLGGFCVGIIALMVATWRISKEPITSSLKNDVTGKDSLMAKTDLTSGKKWSLLIKNIVFGILILLIGLILIIIPIYNSAIIPSEYLFVTNLLAPIFIILGVLLIKESIVSHTIIEDKKDTIDLTRILFGILITFYVIIYSYGVFKDPDIPGMAMFFSAGLALLFGLLIVIIYSLFYFSIKSSRAPNASYIVKNDGNSRDTKGKYIGAMVVRNITRNRFRSISTIIMFSLIVFLIFALATNIMLQQSGQKRAEELAGGGYDMLGETSLPVNFDLNNASSRADFGLDHKIFTTIDVTPLKSVGHEAGKCSNMNAKYPPKIFGVDEKFITENEFKFMRAKKDIDEPAKIWNELLRSELGSQESSNAPSDNSETIPIIGDYETLIWLYHGDIGSIFEINDDYGETHRLEVIAIINSPIFAGSFVMAESDFDNMFPFSGQLKSFLFKTSSDPEEAKSVLEWEMRSFGMAISTIEELTEESVKYVSAYMNLFQLYLYFGLTVGISALGILSLRAINERRYEIGVLKAIGFHNKRIFSLFIYENTTLCSVGILIGATAGIIMALVSYPFWGLAELEFDMQIAGLLVLVMISIIVLTDLLTFYPAYRASKLTTADTLRDVE